MVRHAHIYRHAALLARVTDGQSWLGARATASVTPDAHGCLTGVQFPWRSLSRTERGLYHHVLRVSQKRRMESILG